MEGWWKVSHQNGSVLEKFSSLVVFELIYSVWQFLVNICAPKPMNLVKPNIHPQFLLHLFRSGNKVLFFTGSMHLALRAKYFLHN